MRRLLIAGVLGLCSSRSRPAEIRARAPKPSNLSSRRPTTGPSIRSRKTFHKATTLQDIDLMMSLWAPHATLSIGSDLTGSGTDEIRRVFLEGTLLFEPTHLISDHPAYKVRITVSGDRGTLHFECHYVDAATGEVVLTTETDMDVARIDGQWLITNMVAGSTELTS